MMSASGILISTTSEPLNDRIVGKMVFELSSLRQTETRIIETHSGIAVFGKRSADAWFERLHKLLEPKKNI